MKNDLIFYFSAKEKGLLPYWTINHGWITGMYYKDPDGNLVEIFFEHFRSAEEFKKNIAPDFSDEPVGTNMDVEILYQLFKDGASFEELIRKGNTVPEGKNQFLVWMLLEICVKNSNKTKVF